MGHTAFCIICGYDVSRSTGARCPECGTRFDPDDASTYASSPHLWHRLCVHAPGIKAWISEHCCSIRCRCCGSHLSGVEGQRCPDCNGWFDASDLTTVLATLDVIPTGVLRLRQIAPFRGLFALAWAIGHTFGGSLQPSGPAG